MRTRTVMAAAAGLLLAGCGGNDTASSCITLDSTMLAAIAEGLTHSDTHVTAGEAVKLPSSEAGMGYNYVAAVKVAGPGMSDVAILGVGSPTAGPITVSDAFARLYFTWGAAAAEGSPIRDFQDALFLTDSADAAAACLS